MCAAAAAVRQSERCATVLACSRRDIEKRQSVPPPLPRARAARWAPELPRCSRPARRTSPVSLPLCLSAQRAASKAARATLRGAALSLTRAVSLTARCSPPPAKKRTLGLPLCVSLSLPPSHAPSLAHPDSLALSLSLPALAAPTVPLSSRYPAVMPPCAPVISPIHRKMTGAPPY